MAGFHLLLGAKLAVAVMGTACDSVGGVSDRRRFGFVGVGLPLTVVEASVSGIIVAFAEEPSTISYCHALIYHRYGWCAGLYLLVGHPSRGCDVGAAS